MTSSKNGIWIAGTGVLAVLIVVASYFLLIGPKRAEAADTQTSAAGVEQSNQTLAAETERLKAQFATIGEQRAELALIQAELPSSTEVPTLLRQFSSFATSSGLTVQEVIPGSLTEYVSTTTTVVAPVATSTDATAEDSTAPATTTVVPSSGIQVMPVSVTVKGSFAGTELFVKNLQADMQRYLLVDTVGVVRADSGLLTTITGSIYVLQGDSTSGVADNSAIATTDGATPAAATSTSTGTVN